MENKQTKVVIKVQGSRSYQPENVKNVLVFIDGVQRGTYIRSNPQKLIKLLQEDYDGYDLTVIG